MALTISASSQETISPQEFLDWCVGNVDPLDTESIAGAAGPLYSLFNNRQFVNDAVCEALRHVDASTRSRQISAQSFVFGSQGGFVVRVNVWSPPDTDDPRSLKFQDDVYSYVMP